MKERGIYYNSNSFNHESLKYIVAFLDTIRHPVLLQKVKKQSLSHCLIIQIYLVWLKFFIKKTPIIATIYKCKKKVFTLTKWDLRCIKQSNLFQFRKITSHWRCCRATLLQSLLQIQTAGEQIKGCEVYVIMIRMMNLLMTKILMNL